MRCPQCSSETEDGKAFCEVCSSPLTGYGTPVPGAASIETLAKLAKLRVRPAVIPWIAAFAVAAALFGPFASLLSKFTSQSRLNSEGTNYLSSAFSAVGTTLAAIVLVPLGLSLLIVAWAALTQRSWAWYAGAFILVVVAIASLTAVVPGMILKIVLLAASAVIGWFWMSRRTKEWYGV